GSPALSILLANSRQQSIGRNLGKMRPAGKGNPRFWTLQPNSPAVSLSMIQGCQTAPGSRLCAGFSVERDHRSTVFIESAGEPKWATATLKPVSTAFRESRLRSRRDEAGSSRASRSRRTENNGKAQAAQ